MTDEQVHQADVAKLRKKFAALQTTVCRVTTATRVAELQLVTVKEVAVET